MHDQIYIYRAINIPLVCWQINTSNNGLQKQLPQVHEGRLPVVRVMI